MAKSTVYFTNEITPEAVLKMYRQLGVELPGKVAVKVHSGEDGNQNFLHPEFMKPVIDAVHGTVVECNTAYGGARNETPKHVQLMKKHGWSDLFDVDIMDAEGPDVVWPVKNGKVLSENLLGKGIENYDSMLVLIHFKGHPDGRLRRRAEAAVHRLCFQRRQDVYPLRRQGQGSGRAVGEHLPAGHLP